jgi:hypothetical protein
MVSQFAKTVLVDSTVPNAQPWLALERTWIRKYPLEGVSMMVGKIIQESIPELPKISEIVLKTGYKAFNSKALTDLVDPRIVTPTSLAQFERDAGPRAFELPHVVKSDSIRLLALSGWRIATQPDQGHEYYEKQHRALQVLGQQALAA